jgi:hypothetical protein
MARITPGHARSGVALKREEGGDRRVMPVRVDKDEALRGIRQAGVCQSTEPQKKGQTPTTREPALGFLGLSRL